MPFSPHPFLSCQDFRHQERWFPRSMEWKHISTLLKCLALYCYCGCCSCCCSYCFCSCCCTGSKKRLPDRKTPWHGRTEKHQNCAQKLPNVTSETARKWRFWRHFPATAAAALAAAPSASALAAAPARKTAAGQENTMARKDGKAPTKIAPKNSLM